MSDQPLMPPESSDENLDMLETTLRETAWGWRQPSRWRWSL
jgi:hypothetical protein